MNNHDRDRERDPNEPPEGSSPARPPREDPPDPEDVDLTPREWHPVPDPDGQGGIAWEEQRKSRPPEDDEAVDGQQATDLPGKAWRKPDNG